MMTMIMMTSMIAVIIIKIIDYSYYQHSRHHHKSQSLQWRPLSTKSVEKDKIWIYLLPVE